MKFYAGIDLHSNNNYIGAIDEKGRVVFQKRNPNDLETIKSLEPFKKYIQGAVVESTFNWYWLVDGLMKEGYKIHLANTTAIQQYSGLKHGDDKSDALWLSEMLRLKILPEGYIYPKETRAVRDLIRRRMQLVQKRTAMLSLKGMINNCTGTRVSRAELRKLGNKDIEKLFERPCEVLSAQSLKEVTDVLNAQISKIEKAVLQKIKLKKEFKNILTVTGIGEILGRG